jgi:hypothetical protein
MIQMFFKLAAGGQTMKRLKSSLLARVALTSVLATAWFGLSPANAVTVTWNFQENGKNKSLSSPQTFHEVAGLSGYDITATGLDATSGTNAWKTTALFAKCCSTGETGLGIHSDKTGNNEIWGKTFIQIDVTAALKEGLKNFSFSMGSTTQKEAWDVFGSNSTGKGAKLTELYKAGHDEGITHTLATGYKYYDFFYDSSLGTESGQGNNVLLATFSGNNNSRTSSAPEPSTWAMMILGFAGLGVMAYRRKSKPALMAV